MTRGREVVIIPPEARKLRSRLDHPVIDADGHSIEYLPVMRKEFRRIGGETAETLARPAGVPAAR